ncbi:hypothetical protein TSAR_005143 [Trichomalopsis sarcophagae]|uniref:Odorant receptor n=1 Tax=Trichomalopsis sarcophagae TaxID=543379 RepID=A0A232FE94_9HYME|nr:hypothetical protein TSAR_005143 [Trichomalopsis sarcophagae]
MMDVREALGPKSNFKYNIFFLSACGIWPLQSKSSKVIFGFLWITQEFIITGAESIKLVEIYKEIDLLLEALPPFIYNRLNDIVFANGMINQHKMKILLRKIQNHWDSLTDESEIQILAKTVKFGMLINVGFIGMVYSALWSCMLLPLLPLVLDIVQPLNESRPLKPLFMCEFFVDPDKYYFTILAQNYMSALASPLPLVGMDLFFINCCNHICGIIGILGFRIDNITKNEALNKECKSTYKQLCKCMDMHQIIFDFCDSINDTFSTNFLVMLFINMSLMSFTGVAVSRLFQEL